MLDGWLAEHGADAAARRPPEPHQSDHRRAASRLPGRQPARTPGARVGPGLGTEAMIVLTDAVELEGDEALATLLDVNRWLIAGALAELRPPARK